MTSSVSGSNALSLFNNLQVANTNSGKGKSTASGQLKKSAQDAGATSGPGPSNNTQPTTGIGSPSNTGGSITPPVPPPTTAQQPTAVQPPATVQLPTTVQLPVSMPLPTAVQPPATAQLPTTPPAQPQTFALSPPVASQETLLHIHARTAAGLHALNELSELRTRMEAEGAALGLTPSIADKILDVYGAIRRSSYVGSDFSPLAGSGVDDKPADTSPPSGGGNAPPPSTGGSTPPPHMGGSGGSPSPGDGTSIPPAGNGGSTSPAGGGTTPSDGGGGSTPPSSGSTPPAGDGGSTPPAGGGGAPPPSDGQGGTPPAQGGGSDTPPPAEQPPGAGGGVSPPPANGGYPPDQHGGGSSPHGPPNGSPPPASGGGATHDGHGNSSGPGGDLGKPPVAGDKGPPDRNDKPGTAPAASGAPLPPNAHGLERSRSAQRDDDTGSDDRESRNAEGKGQKVDEKSQPSTVGHAKGSDSGHLPVSNGAMATDYKAATDAYGKAGKLGRGK